MSRAELDFLAAVARDAGRVIMQHYSTDFRVDYKGPGDPVTDADRAANTLICERLSAQFPDAAIVAEESSEQAYRGYRQKPCRHGFRELRKSAGRIDGTVRRTDRSNIGPRRSSDGECGPWHR